MESYQEMYSKLAIGELSEGLVAIVDRALILYGVIKPLKFCGELPIRMIIKDILSKIIKITI